MAVAEATTPAYKKIISENYQGKYYGPDGKIYEAAKMNDGGDLVKVFQHHTTPWTSYTVDTKDIVDKSKPNTVPTKVQVSDKPNSVGLKALQNENGQKIGLYTNEAGDQFYTRTLDKSGMKRYQPDKGFTKKGVAKIETPDGKAQYYVDSDKKVYTKTSTGLELPEGKVANVYKDTDGNFVKRVADDAGKVKFEKVAFAEDGLAEIASKSKGQFVIDEAGSAFSKHAVAGTTVYKNTSGDLLQKSAAEGAKGLQGIEFGNNGLAKIASDDAGNAVFVNKDLKAFTEQTGWFKDVAKNAEDGTSVVTKTKWGRIVLAGLAVATGAYYGAKAIMPGKKAIPEAEA